MDAAGARPATGQLQLVVPHAGLKISYLAHVAEFEAHREPPVPFTVGFETGDFAALIDRLRACSAGIGLPEGFVPHSTFWLVRNGNEVVGVSNVRHSLTSRLRREGGNIGYGIRPSARGQGLGTEILRLMLPRAAELGLPKVLITCGKTNHRSAKVILNNGGVLDSEEFISERGETVQRFWVETRRGD